MAPGRSARPLNGILCISLRTLPDFFPFYLLAWGSTYYTCLYPDVSYGPMFRMLRSFGQIMWFVAGLWDWSFVVDSLLMCVRILFHSFVVPCCVRWFVWKRIHWNLLGVYFWIWRNDFDFRLEVVNFYAQKVFGVMLILCTGFVRLLLLINKENFLL